MKKIAIYGAGGLGKEVLTIIKAINDVHREYDFIGFFDDNKHTDVLGDFEDINSIDEKVELIVAVGNPMVKSQLVNNINNKKVTFAKLVHPSVIIGDNRNVQLHDGVIICAGTIITTDVELKEHVLINLNCTLGHDVQVGVYTSIMPGVNIAGNVAIGNETFIGSGANIINNLSIGAGATVGAGAVVISDVEPGTTVVGVPAQIIKKDI